jgi:glycosyltransferase involved in cell wall biosynthesis
VTVHDLILESFPQYTRRRVLRRAYRTIAAASIRHATAVVTVSDSTRQDLARWYPAALGKSAMIPNGVEARFKPVWDAGRLADVASRYALPRRFVLGVGAGRPHKNLGVLVEAARHLSSETDLCVVLVSAPDPRFVDTVGEQIARLGPAGRAVRVPFVAEEDLAAVYSLAECFVLPSLVEGFGLPILEAMAAGTPVIASARSSLPEVGGDAALYFEPTDALGLAQKIRALAGDADLRARQIELGRARAATFSWERAARSTRRLYADVVSARRSRRPERRKGVKTGSDR